jgi:hypothetical protein
MSYLGAELSAAYGLVTTGETWTGRRAEPMRGPIVQTDYKDLLNEAHNQIYPENVKDEEIEKVASESYNVINVIKHIKNNINTLKTHIANEEQMIKDLNKYSLEYDDGFTTFISLLKAPENEEGLNKHKENFYAIKNDLYKMQKAKVEESMDKIKVLKGKMNYLSNKIGTMTDNITKEINDAGIKSAGKCGICIENDIQLAFECGHTVCEGCYNAGNLRACHVCRHSISRTIKLYL